MLTYKGTVFPWHCDEMGHMNVMWYVGKFDEATRHFFHELGITPAFVRETRRGMAAVEQTIQYKRELLVRRFRRPHHSRTAPVASDCEKCPFHAGFSQFPPSPAIPSRL